MATALSHPSLGLGAHVRSRRRATMSCDRSPHRIGSALVRSCTCAWSSSGNNAWPGPNGGCRLSQRPRPHNGPVVHTQRHAFSISEQNLSRRDSLLIRAASGREDSVPLVPAEELPTPKGQEGSVLGAIALITGTSVGAGILALPLETAPAGFVPSASLLLACWAFLTLEAFLIAEVNVGLRRKRQESQSNAASDVISLRTMAEETLGPVGGWLSTATYTFLSYTLMVAYVAKAADVTTLGTDIPYDVAAAGFIAVLGGLVYAGDTHTTDWINRIMTGALLGLFGLIMTAGSIDADWSQLSHQDWSQAPAALPVLFLSLVFHDLIPVLCAYLEGDAKRIRMAIALGGAVPLAMFLGWDAVALSLSHGVPGVDPLESLIGLGGPAQVAVIEGFSLLAVMTSFLGTALSMSEFFIEQLGSVFSPKESLHLQDMTENRKEGELKLSRQQALRTAAFGLVLVPSWILACNIPHAFFSASEAAGAYGMTVLYGIFPPLMFWKSRQSSSGADVNLATETSSSWLDQPAGGLALASMAACAFSVIVSQAVLDTAELRNGSLGPASTTASPVAVLATPTPVSNAAKTGPTFSISPGQSLSAPPLDEAVQETAHSA